MKTNPVSSGTGVRRSQAFLALVGIALLGFFFLTGCQTMTVGKGEDVIISVDQPGAQIYLNKVLLSTNSYAEIKLNKAGGPYKITARKTGFKEAEVKVTSKMNWRATSVAFVDNFFGIIKMGSFVYECFTGGFKRLDDRSIRFELVPYYARAATLTP